MAAPTLRPLRSDVAGGLLCGRRSGPAPSAAAHLPGHLASRNAASTMTIASTPVSLWPRCCGPRRVRAVLCSAARGRGRGPSGGSSGSGGAAGARVQELYGAEAGPLGAAWKEEDEGEAEADEDPDEEPGEDEDEEGSEEGALARSVVQIRTLHRVPNFARPWEEGHESESSSSAFVVELPPAPRTPDQQQQQQGKAPRGGRGGGRPGAASGSGAGAGAGSWAGPVGPNGGRLLLMTTAGAVEAARKVEACRSSSGSTPFPASVVAVCLDLDVALLAVADPAFWGAALGGGGGGGGGSSGRRSGGRAGRGRGTAGAGGGAGGGMVAPLVPLRLDPALPSLRRPLIVAGFPLGGESLCITSGVVSRVEVLEYSHSGRALLALQVDAPLNNGGWGGPALCASSGAVVGMAFQKAAAQSWIERYDDGAMDMYGGEEGDDDEGEEAPGDDDGDEGGFDGGDGGEDAENIGYLVPSQLLALALADLAAAEAAAGAASGGSASSSAAAAVPKRGGRGRAAAARPAAAAAAAGSSPAGASSPGPAGPLMLEGRPRLGLRYQRLESPVLRSALGLGPGQSGVLVTGVDPSGSTAGVMQMHDVLVEVAGRQVSSDGSTLLRPGQRVLFGHWAAVGEVGQELPLTVLRGGHRLELKARLRPSGPGFLPVSLGPSARPQYLVAGPGLVFTAFSVPYWYQLMGGSPPSSRADRMALSRGLVPVFGAMEWGLPEEDGPEELVLLTEVLECGDAEEGEEGEGEEEEEEEGEDEAGPSVSGRGEAEEEDAEAGGGVGCESAAWSAVVRGGPRRVWSVDGVRVRNLTQLAAAVVAAAREAEGGGAGADKFLRIALEPGLGGATDPGAAGRGGGAEGEQGPLLVLSASSLAPHTRAVLRHHGIAQAMGQEMRRRLGSSFPFEGQAQAQAQGGPRQRRQQGRRFASSSSSSGGPDIGPGRTLIPRGRKRGAKTPDGTGEGAGARAEPPPPTQRGPDARTSPGTGSRGQGPEGSGRGRRGLDAPAGEGEGGRGRSAPARAPRGPSGPLRPGEVALGPSDSGGGCALRPGDRDAGGLGGTGTEEQRGGSGRAGRDGSSASAPPPSSRGGRSVFAPAPAFRAGNRGSNPIRLIKDCETLGQLEALVEAEAEAWTRGRRSDAINTALAKACQLGESAGADASIRHHLMDRLGAAYLPLVEGRRRGADATIPLYACAKAKYWGGGLAAALVRRLSADGGALLRTADGKELSNLWWSRSEALDSAEGRQVLSSIDLPRLLEASAALFLHMPLNSQDCSNTLIACSRLQWSNERLQLTHHLTARLVELGAEAKPQELANSLYALGELAEDVGHRPRPEALQGLARVVADWLSQNPAASKPQDLSQVLLGCAKLSYSDPALLRPLTAAAARAAPRMVPQALVNSLYSLALLQPSVSAHGGAAEALAEECQRRRFSGFIPQAISNSAWALATMGYADQGWYAAAVEAAGQPGAMQEAKPQEWSNLWYALALVRHQPASGRLLERTGEAAGVLRKGTKAQECANLLWALANLRLYDERLLDALAGRLGELLGQDPKQVKEQELCNSLWALAVMGPDVLSRHSGLVEGLVREAERRWAAEGGRAYRGEELVQLWYAQLELAHVGGGELQCILGAGEGVQGSLLRAARAEAESQAAEEVQASPFELQVASALQRLAERLGPGTLVSVQRGCVVPGLGRAADVVVELTGGRRVAVEADGPWHYFANRPRDPTAVDGPTELRNRQLGRMFGAGNVLSVPYWEWDFKTAPEHEELLTSLLRSEGTTDSKTTKPGARKTGRRG
ncbi:hypothetical protein HYH03_004073 [Edaphochlamys debaryana]|uniref:RAP domain-containing protein n=1 Tax=Edaphochlamys debaryana TaxID=47281 RepID=A0A836C3H4_9CHLO|nr:hypothetical protein HYH03_004073 [Edaphochlamys debaryana]|eukprot:KAG2497802.1 hypothetical protein HYH03_004073 [Edaphochlamys debaryana]